MAATSVTPADLIDCPVPPSLDACVLLMDAAFRFDLFPTSFYLTIAEREAIARWLNTVDPRTKRTLTLRFGLDGIQPKTLDEIGRLTPRLMKDSTREPGVSRERARQILSSGLRRLRHPQRWRRYGIDKIFERLNGKALL